MLDAMRKRQRKKSSPPPELPSAPVAVGSQGTNPILRMTEEQFLTTPVDQMLKMYLNDRPRRRGTDGLCDRDFGVNLVDRWRETGSPCCSKGSTTMTCHLIHQTKHAGKGDQLLVGDNVLFNFGDLARDGEKIPKKMYDQYVDSRHNQQYSKVPWSPGSMAGQCTPDPKAGWRQEFFPGWNVDFFKAFRTTNQPIGPQSPTCDVWEERPIIIVQRDTFANLFHNSEDFVNMFLALAIMQLPLRDLQILVTDIYPKGPFWPIWSEVFNDGVHPPLTAWDISRKYGEQNVCFKKAAVAILGAAAPITVASWDSDCIGTALVRAYSDFVVRGLRLHTVNKDKDPKAVTVTYAARKASVTWPERNFCDTAHSYFDCNKLGHLAKRKLGRMVRNDEALLAALKRLEHMQLSNGANVTVRLADFNVLTFPEQVKIDRTSDVMVGPHGAGLMHNVFMPDRAALVELFVDGSSANRHFHNLATWAGHRYEGRVMSNPVDTAGALRMVQAAVESVDTTAAVE